MELEKINIFKIAGIKVSFNADESVQLSDNFLPFLETGQNSDCKFSFHSCEDLILPEGKMIISSLEYDAIQERNGKVYRIFKDHKNGDQLYAYSFVQEDGSGSETYYKSGFHQFFDGLNNCFFHTGWEEVFAAHGRVILHASCIKSELGGILFSGRSGIGKSTQAELWCKYENAILLNGDRPIICKENDMWRAYGSPYAGSSECYINDSVSIRAVVLLGQGTVCELKKLSASEAFRGIFAGCTVSSWSRRMTEQVLTSVTELVSDIPVYQLICTPDQNAVNILKKELQRGEEDETA